MCTKHVVNVPACRALLVFRLRWSIFLLPLDFQILDDTFASQMQQLLGNLLQEKDLEPPRSIIEVRSVLGKDVPVNKNNTYFY